MLPDMTSSETGIHTLLGLHLLGRHNLSGYDLILLLAHGVRWHQVIPRKAAANFNLTRSLKSDRTE